MSTREKLPVRDKMRIIHDSKRPTIDDYVKTIFDDFIELHGDRAYADDYAVCAGIATFQGIPVTVIGHRKGKTTEENIKANFAMAEKFHRPVIFFVDTSGAFPGVGAEERGQGEAIARCLSEFMVLRTPIISIVTGEGGSGGALAFAVADRVLMLENAIYSVISPRGCASILWKDASREFEAAERLKITADDLFSFGMIEGIIPESGSILRNVKKAISEQLRSLLSEPQIDQLLEKRYEKFRKIGIFEE